MVSNLVSNAYLFREPGASEDFWCKAFPLNIKSVYLEPSWPAVQAAILQYLSSNSNRGRKQVEIFFQAEWCRIFADGKIQLSMSWILVLFQWRQSYRRQPPRWLIQESKDGISGHSVNKRLILTQQQCAQPVECTLYISLYIPSVVFTAQ